MAEIIKSRINNEVEMRVMSELVKFLSLSNPLQLCSGYFPSRLCQPGCISKDPTVSVGLARPPPLSTFSKII